MARQQLEMVRRLPVLVATCLLALVALSGPGCGSEAGLPSASDNLLANPGFEEGPEPWVSLTTPRWGTPFEVSTAQAHASQASAYLKMRSDGLEMWPEGRRDMQVFGVVQDLSAQEFPERLSGYYYVDSWERGSEVQYLQAVVVVWGPDLPEGFPNYQVRYLLAGIDHEPFEMANARFVLANGEQPKIGEWVRFDLSPAEDFQELWGAVPSGFERLRVLFVTRYERRTSDQPDVIADVYYDDFYLGP